MRPYSPAPTGVIFCGRLSLFGTSSFDENRPHTTRASDQPVTSSICESRVLGADCTKDFVLESGTDKDVSIVEDLIYVTSLSSQRGLDHGAQSNVCGYDNLNQGPYN